MAPSDIAFVLIQSPDDDEIAQLIATQCAAIAAMLHRRDLAYETLHINVVSRQSFYDVAAHLYGNAEIVHVAAHGDEAGIDTMRDALTWEDVGAVLTKLVPPLSGKAKRVLCLSCCYSRCGYRALRKTLQSRFTGIYCFRDNEVYFDTIMMVWSMFYGTKPLGQPASKIKKRINRFFGRRTLEYHRL